MPVQSTLLRVLITERHWQRYETFAHQFSRAASELAAREAEPSIAHVTVSQRQFERWYAGRVRTAPHPDSCRILEYMFGRSVTQLLAPEDKSINQAVRHELASGKGDTTPQVIDPLRIVQPIGDADDPSDSLSHNPERILAMAARKALRFAAAADSSNVGEHSLDQLRFESGRLAVAYLQEPLSQILSDIVDLQDHVFNLLDGRQRPKESRDLYVVAGLASGMLAKAANDLSEPRMAMTHARTALLCARNAEHAGLAAWVLGIQSLTAYWADRPGEALNYAKAGQEMVSETRGTVGIWLASLEARAWSALGNGAASLSAIQRAVDLRDRVEPDDLDELGGMCHFARARQLYYSADAGASLPAEQASGKITADTARYASEAIAVYESGSPQDRSFGDEAGSRADLAIAHIRTNNFDGAAEAFRPVLDLPAGLRIRGIISSVLNVHRAVSVKGADATIGREMQAEIEEYCRTPVAILPALPR